MHSRIFVGFDNYCIKYTLLHVKYATSLMGHLLLEENDIFGTFEEWGKEYLQFKIRPNFSVRKKKFGGGGMGSLKFEKLIQYICRSQWPRGRKA